MKQLFSGIVICSLFLLLMGLVSKWESRFTVHGTVKTAICGKCCLVDDLGKSWIYYSDDLQAGDVVKITFYDNNSTTHSDDEIVKVSVQE